MEKGSGSSLTRIEELFEGEVGYQTPKVETRGVVFQEERLLVVREKIDKLWSLPGGWVDPNETPREAVEREVMEESGYEVQNCWRSSTALDTDIILSILMECSSCSYAAD